MIWEDTNARVHKQKSSIGFGVARFVNQYVKELEASVPFEAKWRYPFGYAIKLNFDSSFDVHKSKLASGVVARNAYGRVLMSCSFIHEWVPSSFAGKALACLRAVQVGMENNWSKVIVEGDTLRIIKKCQSTESNKSIA